MDVIRNFFQALVNLSANVTFSMEQQQCGAGRGEANGEIGKPAEAVVGSKCDANLDVPTFIRKGRVLSIT